jgi:hypothetical protein
MQTTAAQAPTQISTDEQHAAALVADCFGPGSPEALRFAQYVVQRNSLPWLTEPAPAATGEVQA